ncbi:MAG: glycerol-3-phosphate 1-O-acyltransferase PlsY [Gammaproteobacteria bacterium]|nr:glycerol-3-phosphate 1-O-acyltransferase PlsY [Gammaproteobacteria bacterium]
MIVSGLFILLSYLLGSLSAAIIVCKLMGLPDPRSQGSGNPGATNVLRIGGKKAAAITLLGDLLKGLIPVALAKLFITEPWALAGVAFAAFLGHLLPVFFKFQGGKGVATSFGVLLGLSWPAALTVLAVWLTMAAVFRISSLSALVAALAAPVAMLWFSPHIEFFWLTTLTSLVLLWRHRSNLQNLLAGKEGKIGDR